MNKQKPKEKRDKGHSVSLNPKMSNSCLSRATLIVIKTTDNVIGIILKFTMISSILVVSL